MEFEVLYHRSWFQTVESVKTGLNASLLVRQPQGKVSYLFTLGSMWHTNEKKIN